MKKDRNHMLLKVVFEFPNYLLMCYRNSADRSYHETDINRRYYTEIRKRTKEASDEYAIMVTKLGLIVSQSLKRKLR
jgi:hypothetical protein